MYFIVFHSVIFLLIIVVSVLRCTDFGYPFGINLQAARANLTWIEPTITNLTRIEPTISSTQCEHSQLLPHPRGFFKDRNVQICYNV